MTKRRAGVIAMDRGFAARALDVKEKAVRGVRVARAVRNFAYANTPDPTGFARSKKYVGEIAAYLNRVPPPSFV